MVQNVGKITWKNHKPNYNTRLYSIWRNMRQRCDNPNNTHYAYYGGKGVRVHSDWEKFINFKLWAEANGYEEHLTLDRICGDKNYSPDNCRWVTRKEQSRNLKSNVWLEHDGKCMLLIDWANELGIKDCTLTKRIKNHPNNPQKWFEPRNERYVRGNK